jgi:cytochrome P450
MTEFIPPFPKRSEHRLSAVETLFRAQKDLLSIWSEDFFSVQFRASKFLNRHIFIANCPELVRYVFVAKHSVYQQKSTLMQKALRPLIGDSLFINDGDIWRTRRQLIASFFTNTHVARYAEIMTAAISETLEHWSHIPAGTEIKVLQEMEKLAVGVICRIIFGKQLGHSQALEVVEAFHMYQAAVEQMDAGSFLGLPDWLPNLKGRQAKQAAERIHKVVDELIADGIQNRKQSSLLALLLEANTKGGYETMSAEQIRNEIIMLFLAGHETTANTMAWSWYLISQCPDVEARLHEEIDRVLGQRTPAYEDISQLSYTRAILDETMRLYPPVPILSRQANAEDTIRSRTIPAGSIMLVVPWLLHRHKLYWDKPDHFIPERFLPDAEPKVDPYAYIPFSIGPRVCVGKQFGLVEATLCLAMVAQRFRLCLPIGHPVTHECRLTLRPKDNLPMRLEPR